MQMQYSKMSSKPSLQTSKTSLFPGAQAGISSTGFLSVDVSQAKINRNVHHQIYGSTQLSRGKPKNTGLLEPVLKEQNRYQGVNRSMDTE